MARQRRRIHPQYGMQLDHELCYRALETRDLRFDGRFFNAVLSTGIYCRPICPARTPKRENCLFLPTAAAAQEAGFRPCLRCRPETAPGTPAWTGSAATVSRALRLIGDGALDQGGVRALAGRLGVGERQLRRLFVRHLGAPPLAVAQTRRLLFAKTLIDQTRLPMSAVALSAGFASIRRFNDSIRRTWRRSPSALRRGAAGGGATDIVLRLAFRPPLAWPVMLRYLAARAIPGVEEVAGDAYRRSIAVAGAHGIVEVRAERNHLRAAIRLGAAAPLAQIAERLRRLFDLGADPDAIAGHLGADPVLAARVAALPGLRVPGAWDGFELAVRAILGQQVAVRAATTLAGRLAAAHGTPIEDAGGGLRFAFPPPERLAGADLTAIGVVRARAAAIAALAAAVAGGRVALETRGGLDETVAMLTALPGIGPWTAHYIAMRALGEPDAFPTADLGLRRAFGGDAAALAAAAEAWRPWRAYAAMYLWMGEGNPDAPGL